MVLFLCRVIGALLVFAVLMLVHVWFILFSCLLLFVGSRRACAPRETTHDMSSYLRFLNSFIESMSVMYVNPASSSSVASLTLLAVLTVYSSSSVMFRSCV